MFYHQKDLLKGSILMKYLSLNFGIWEDHEERVPKHVSAIYKKLFVFKFLYVLAILKKYSKTMVTTFMIYKSVVII